MTPKEYFVIPIRNGIAFPYVEVLLTITNPPLIKLLSDLNKKKEPFVLINEDKAGNFSNAGVLAQTSQILENKFELNIIAQGMNKLNILEINQEGEYFKAKSEIANDKPDTDINETNALMAHAKKELKSAINIGKAVDFLILGSLLSEEDPMIFSYQFCSVIEGRAEEKQFLIETNQTKERLEKAILLLGHEIKVLEIEKEIASKAQEKFTKDAKEAVLRERMKEIKKELGEDMGSGQEIDELRTKITQSQMPENVIKKANNELERLAKMGPFNPESSYVRNYLEWITELPWSNVDRASIDLIEAKKILDEDHFGLEKVKERILEYLAVQKLKQAEVNAGAENILCFVGPPGTGKTSIGKSIAKTLNRKFISMPLGGIKDEAEIRGHRRTYVGSMPGRIIQQIRNAGTKNPVFILDEIDKITDSFMGNPSAALLEVLDPAQNHAFQDNYLEIPFDLSQVFFITTCNTIDSIPPALRDRLEMIQFFGYTEDEKLAIAKEFLVKKQTKTNGLKPEDLSFTDGAILEIIRYYTRESGVRNLERNIATICRKIARNKIENNQNEKNRIEEKDIKKYLGQRMLRSYLPGNKDEVGVATGLAWTQAGGEIVFVEAAAMPGTGQLTLTGQLGQVMQESCKAALSYVRSHAKELDIEPEFYKNTDVHVHVPEGSAPKDGPSAGTAIVTALTSALSRHPVKKEIGMTGEITLRGQVLEISGVKEKLIAAHRAKLEKVFLPKYNEKDLEDVPKRVKEELSLCFVDDIKEILNQAIVK